MTIDQPKACVITGAAGHIGQATAELFQAKGWTTIGIDRNPCSGAVDVALKADLSCPHDLASVSGTLSDLPRVDVLVNVAAEQPLGGLEGATTLDWETTLRANLIAPAELCRAVSPQLRRTQGAIVSITSVHSRATSAGMLIYSTSKAALSGLMRALAVDLAPYGIRANSVAPGAVDTPMLHKGLARSPDPRGALATLVSRTPLRRVAAPEEIAHLVYSMVQPEMRYMTGQEVVIDGGVSALLASESMLK